jgi:cation transport regulator
MTSQANKNEKELDFIKSTDDIPSNLKEILPTHAQHIYMKAHNRGLRQYAEEEKRRYGGTQDEAAHRVAWAAVRTKYEKNEYTGKWQLKEGMHEKDEPEYEEDPKYN